MSSQLTCPRESKSQKKRVAISEDGYRISKRIVDGEPRNNEENPKASSASAKRQVKEGLRQEKEIGYEEVTLRIPKLVMNLLREHERIISLKVNEYLQLAIVTMLKADLDAHEQFNPQTEEMLSKARELLELTIEDQL